MVWFVGVCLAAQRHNKGGHERYLGADSLGQGAESVVPSIVGKISSSRPRYGMIVDKHGAKFLNR
jgi:hypothetical protein